MRTTNATTGLSGAVVMQTGTIPTRPTGGRDLAPSQPFNARTPVRLVHPADRTAERYVTLTTIRLHATTTYAVAVTDGTGRLTDDARPTLHTDLSSARKAERRLIDRWGGVAKQPLPLNPREHKPSHRAGYGPGGLPRPKQTASGQWRASFQHLGQHYRRTFDTEHEAYSYIDKIKGVQ